MASDSTPIKIACMDCLTKHGDGIHLAFAEKSGWTEIQPLRFPMNKVNWYDHVGICPRCTKEMQVEIYS